MTDDAVIERIAAWEAGGIIDAATAERLRQSELDRDPKPTSPTAPSAAGPEARGAPSTIAAVFGPGVSLVEMFSYVGGAFVLAAWFAFSLRLTAEAGGVRGQWLTVASLAIPAAALFLLGTALHRGSARRSRAAGVCLALSTSLVSLGVAANLAILFEPGEWQLVVATAAGFLVALAYRWLHPSLLTDLAALGWATGLVGATLDLVAATLVPEPTFGTFGLDRTSGLVLAVLSSAAWIGTGIGFGVVALSEASQGSADALRRAAVTRFWAGTVVVVGVALAVMRSFYDDVLGETVRVIPPWAGVLVVVLVSAVLIERAFRRESSAFVFAAALGLIIALSDLNVSYVAPAGGTEIALLLEGVLLLAAALGAERLSGRIWADRWRPTQT
jgi:hypothetical protein